MQRNRAGGGHAPARPVRGGPVGVPLPLVGGPESATDTRQVADPPAPISRAAAAEIGLGR